MKHAVVSWKQSCKRISLFGIFWVILGSQFVVGQEASSSLPTTSTTPYSFHYHACPFKNPRGEKKGKTLLCGTLTVPENRRIENSKTVEVAFAILKSLQRPALTDSVIYLEGGPGGSALAAVDSWLESSLRQNRDLILVDQRGTGYSKPVLNCIELDDDFDESKLENVEIDNDPLALEILCAKRLVSEGIDLTAYNSRENAADIAALRQALNLEEVNLYGISYGTRLALTVMRDHPQGIRSVVLDSTYPPQVQGVAEAPMHTQRAFDQLFENCRKQEACNEAFPRLEPRFYQKLAQLNSSPYELYEDLDLTGAEVVSSLNQTLYDSSLIPSMPFAIDLLTKDYFDEAYALLTGELTGEDLEKGMNPMALVSQFFTAILFSNAQDSIDDDAEGLYNSIECNEDVPFQDMTLSRQLARKVQASIRQGLLVDSEMMFDTCEIWNSGTASAIENEAVKSDIPTLVLAGDLDPVTPPEWGQLAANELSRSKYVVFPNMGHGLIDVKPCPTAIVQTFLTTPSGEIDISCASNMKIEFFVPRKQWVQ